MALGSELPVTSVTATHQAQAVFTCEVDQVVNTVGPGAIGAGLSFFVQVCPGCGTRYLVRTNVSAVAVTVTRTS